MTAVIAIVLVVTGCSSESGRGTPVVFDLDASPSAEAPASENPPIDPATSSPARDLNADCPADARAIFERQELIFVDSTEKIVDPAVAEIVTELQMECVLAFFDMPIDKSNTLFGYYFEPTDQRSATFAAVLASAGFSQTDTEWRNDSANFSISEIDYTFDAANPVAGFFGPDLKRDFTVLGFTLGKDE